MDDTVGKYSESWNTIINLTCISTKSVFFDLFIYLFIYVYSVTIVCIFSPSLHPKSVLFIKVEYSAFLVNSVLCEEYFWWRMECTVTYRFASTSTSQSALGHYVQTIYTYNILYYIHIFVLFFLYHLIPLYPQCNHHTVFHVYESLFLFSQTFHTLNSSLQELLSCCL